MTDDRGDVGGDLSLGGLPRREVRAILHVHPGGQVAVSGKQHARQSLVSAATARSRGPGQGEKRKGSPAQEEAPKGTVGPEQGSQEAQEPLESHRTATGGVDEGN